MKICFLLQRRFAYIGWEMANLLEEKYGVHEFSGYVSMRTGFDFIKKHSTPRFSPLVLDQEIHARYKNEIIDPEFIKKLEEDFGLPNLWPYLELDRIIRSGQLIRAYPYDTPLYDHEDMIRLVQVTAKAINKLLDEAKPEVIIFSVVGALYGLMLYAMAKKRGIKTLVIHCGRVGAKHTLSEDFHSFSYVNERFEKYQAGLAPSPADLSWAKAKLEKFRCRPEPYRAIDRPEFQPYNRRRQFSFLRPAKFINSVTFRFKTIAAYLKDPFRSDYDNVNPFWEIWDSFKKKIRVLVGFGDFYDLPDLAEAFALYPLHREPEITTLLYAPFYKDQLWLIKQLARSLPLNFKLYVKEHTAMVGERRRAYYQELKKIPNVKLINPEVKTFSLLQSAKLIFTISGTAGWEAVQLKKPVIIFSDIFYSRLPMVKKCVAIAELPYLVKDQLENFKHDEAALLNFLTALKQESADIELAKIWQAKNLSELKNIKAELMPLVDLTAAKLNLKPIK